MTRFERFEAAEKARPRGDAAREVEARSLERQALYLRGFGLPREDEIADDLDREAKAIREHNGRVMGGVSGRCAAPRRRSAGLRPEPVPVSALRAAATNAKSRK